MFAILVATIDAWTLEYDVLPVSYYTAPPEIYSNALKRNSHRILPLEHWTCFDGPLRQ